MERRLCRELVRWVTAAFVVGLPVVGGAEPDDDQTREANAERSDESDGETDSEETSDDSGEVEGLSEAELEKWRRKRRKARASTKPANQDWDEYWTWDLKMEVGVARQASRYGLKGDARTGVVYVPEPNGYALGVVGELSNISDPAVGLEAEMLSMLFGTYAQVGGMLDIDGEPTLTAGVGWQLFAFELQYEPHPDFGGDSPWIGMAKLHFPVSWLVRALTGNRPD